MKTTSHRAPSSPEACSVRGHSSPSGLAAVILGFLLLLGCFAPAPRVAGAPLFPIADKPGANPPPESAGPTLNLDYSHSESPDNSVADFMYFVQLISLEPVSVVKSPGNTQRARMLSATRSFTSGKFQVSCEFEFTGEGSQRNVFDHTEKMLRHERELKEGGSLDHQLDSINIEGAGSICIEVEGTRRGDALTVTEVRLRFNSDGQPSRVTIGLHDIEYRDGAFRTGNDTVARVNTLTFQRKPGPTKMEITVASVNRKDAGDTFWQNLIGGLKAATANLLLKPIAVDPMGNEAMLNFGLALASEAPAFTFPRATNLKAGGVESAHETIALN